MRVCNKNVMQNNKVPSLYWFRGFWTCINRFLFFKVSLLVIFLFWPHSVGLSWLLLVSFVYTCTLNVPVSYRIVLIFLRIYYVLTVNVLQAVSDSADSSHDVTPSKSSSKVGAVFLHCSRDFAQNKWQIIVLLFWQQDSALQHYALLQWGFTRASV